MSTSTVKRHAVKDSMEKLVHIGPILPGTLETRQRPLKDVERRRRKDAGTFHVLSYSVKGHNSSMYVKATDYAAVAGMVENYSRARDLIIELGLEMVAACRQEGIEHAAAAWAQQMGEIAANTGGVVSEARQVRVLGRSRDSWKASSTRRAGEIAQLKVTIRDQRASRDKWRTEALASRRKAKADAEELGRLKSEAQALALRLATDSKKKH